MCINWLLNTVDMLRGSVVNKTSAFSLQYLRLRPINYHYQHTPEANVTHLISTPPRFLGPS
jgi:hypothetical protein